MTALRRRQVIADFLATARDTLHQYGVKISADLYGIMAWGRMEDQAEIYRRKLAEVQRRKANAVGERAPSSEQKSQDQ